MFSEKKVNLIRINKVAIVIPAYNVDLYITDCLNSLSHQTFSNFVALIIDDGSTDKTGTIADEFSKKDSRFKAYHKSNSGVASARNFALDKIELIESISAVFFLDSDDILHPECLHKAVMAFDNTQADCVIFGYRVFDKRGFDKTSCYTPLKKDLSSTEAIFDHFLNCSKMQNQTQLWFLLNKAFRSSCIKGVRFNEKMKRGEDVRFFMDLRSKIKSAIIIPDILLDYRLRKSSLSHSNINLLYDLDLYSELLIYHSDEFTPPQLSVLHDTMLNVWRKCLIYVFGQDPTSDNITFLRGITRNLSKRNLITGLKNRKRVLYLSFGDLFMRLWSINQYRKYSKKNQLHQTEYFE